LAGSDKVIPPLSQSEIEDIQTWKEADKNYEGIWRKMKERMTEEFRTVTGPSKAAWWEKDAVDLTRRKPREQFDVRYPRQKKDRERRKTGRREGLKLCVFSCFTITSSHTEYFRSRPRKLDPEDANRPEQLVPIRLEFDVEHHKMRDSFVWNLNGKNP
jgi:SWI/SNF-related matrix-associated actin-dependent regulator of chromatin subfamily B protein 1